MESTRFDRLARSIGTAPSRRRLLAAVGSAALGAAGLRGGEAAPKTKNKGRKPCKSDVGRGRAIRGLCYAFCKNPGGCAAPGGNLPNCGSNSLDCGCTKLLSGNTACILPRGGSDLCGRPACQSNQDCELDNVCVKVPGCCADRNQVCVFPCIPLV